MSDVDGFRRSTLITGVLVEDAPALRLDVSAPQPPKADAAVGAERRGPGRLQDELVAEIRAIARRLGRQDGAFFPAPQTGPSSPDPLERATPSNVVVLRTVATAARPAAAGRGFADAATVTRAPAANAGETGGPSAAAVDPVREDEPDGRAGSLRAALVVLDRAADGFRRSVARFDAEIRRA